MTPQQRYTAMLDALCANPDHAFRVNDMRHGTLGVDEGATALRICGYIFAMLYRHTLVVALPDVRIAALVAAGVGTRLHYRGLDHWLEVTAPDADWKALAEEAYDFVLVSR